MNRLIGLLLVLFVGTVSAGDLAQKILERNGDVYVLVTRQSKTPGEGVGVYKFTRIQDYSRSEVGRGNNGLQSKLPFYEGLAVDKFGHVKFFRNEGDKDSSGKPTQKNLLTTTNEIHSSMGGAPFPAMVSVNVYDGGGIQGPNETFEATPPGWAYVVETNGDVGWAKVYDWDRIPVAYGSGNAYLYKTVDVEAKFSPKVEIIPRGVDGGVNNVIRKTWHTYSWWHPKPNKGSYAVGVGAARQGCNGVGGSATVENGSNCFQGAMGVGPEFYPPINAYWVSDLAPGTSAWQTIKMRGRRITKVVKSVTSLYLDSYLTKEDNFALYDASSAGANPDPRFDLKANVDYFGSGGSDKFLQPNSALNTSLSFSQTVNKYNVCNDMCGLGGQPENPPPLVINEARATFSSGGNSTQNQRSYMVKTASENNGADITTWVVQFAYDEGADEYTQTNLIKWAGGIEPGVEISANDGVMSDAQGPMGGIDKKGDADPKRVIIYQKAGGNFTRSVQSAKRFKAEETPSDAKDYIYISDLPSSHFNVSSSFWGTGGVVWWAKNAGGKSVELHYEQYNHQTGKLIRSSGGSPIVADNVESLRAIGADGDNFVYILHAGKGTDGSGGLENAADMASLMTPISGARIVQLANEGRIINTPTSFPLDPGSYCAGNPAGPCDVPVQMRVSAGLIVEKIAPLAGSKPVKIGVVPLGLTDAVCTAILRFTDPNAITGGYATPWSCGDASTDVALEDFNVEMAVINVANPPATGGSNQIDIVDAAPTGEGYLEDTKYTFYMENPPAFDGPVAQLGLTLDNSLLPYGDVYMVSNYDTTGIERLKTQLGCSGAAQEPEKVPADINTEKADFKFQHPNDCRSYFDNDSNEGNLFPSYIWEDLIKNGANELHTKVGGTRNGEGQEMVSGSAEKTLRWRWRIRAKTPPQSLHNFQSPTCEPLKADESGRTWEHDPGAGLMYDSCWQDLNTSVAKAASTSTYQPDPLDFVFDDPGSYEVTLMFGGLRFNADNLTFLDNPDSVVGEVVVTWYTMPIHVGAKPAQAGPEIRDLVLAQNDAATNLIYRADMAPNSQNWLDRFTSEDGLAGDLGRLPVVPTATYAANGAIGQPLTVTSEGQNTPIVAEADISFFRIRELDYINVEKGGDLRQEKSKGVGAWDYTYPGGGSIPIKGGTFSPIDKRGTLPPNARGLTLSRAAPGESAKNNELDFELITEAAPASPGAVRRGYDASGDPKTGAGFRFNDSGIDGGFIPLGGSFEDAHQGTLASCKYFPSWSSISSGDECLLKHPMSFYTWWEIKYAWFLRYRTPQGDWKKTVVRTGNLAEVFLLNMMAEHGSEGWKRVVANLAPTVLRANPDGTDDSSKDFTVDSPLMKWVTNEDRRRLRIRVPLMNSGAILNAANELTEMDAPLRDLSDGGDFVSLYEQIHPMSFKVPSGATVYELGLQIFYPIMNWEGREPDDALAPDPKYAYYDAVYWGADSDAAGTAQKSDMSFATYSFGETFHSWRRFATSRIPLVPGKALDEEAKNMGLMLALPAPSEPPGGFVKGADGSDNLSYFPPGNYRDDFAEFHVLDLTPPELRLISGGALDVPAGGRASEDLVVELEDNSPYSIYADSETLGADDVPTPALSMLSYEIGYDKRNLYGIGFKQPGRAPESWAFGFNLSYTNFDGTAFSTESFADWPQFEPGDTPELWTPTSIAKPGFNFSASDILDDYSGFYYPQKRSFTSDASYWMLESAPDIAGGMTPAHMTANPVDRMNANQEYHYLPVGGYMVKGSARTRTLGTSPSDLNPLMLAFRPKIDADPFRMRPVYDGADESRIEYVDSLDASLGYERMDAECMASAKTENPLKITDVSKCRIRTRWKLRKKYIIAPFFMDGEASQTMNIYAKGRDVRIQPDLNAFELPSVVPKASDLHAGAAGFSFNSDWQVRQGAEDLGEYADKPGIAGSTLNSRFGWYLNNEQAQRATKIGEMRVYDQSPPNFRIILKDAKHRSQAEVVVMGAQAFDPDVENVGDRVFAFRSLDTRQNSGNAEDSAFTMGPFRLLNLRDADRDSLNMALLAGGATSNQVWRIPEDVRFEVRVVAADNRTLDDIEIKITGGHGAGWSHPDGALPVAEADKYPDAESSAGRIYQQMKMASAFHEYPLSGKYDVLRVEVRDEPGGNGSTILIPIEVIRQNVSFNKIGSQQRLR